jgi:2-oxoglutarate dehydrogenase E1 component
MLRAYRKPLVVMTPKSMLRNPMAVSSLEDLADKEFQVVIPEVDEINAKQVERVVFCAGKIYYELLEQRRAMKLNNIAIIRIEQLYPFPNERCAEVLKPYLQAKDIVWCQEEPQNQGAWNTMQPYLNAILAKDQQLRYVGRQASASPAVGYHAVHEQEQKGLVVQALK